ncbi:MAG: type III pantothenate kinase [Oligosphaeraceae bacterium]
MTTLLLNVGNTRVAVGEGLPGMPEFRAEYFPTEQFLAQWTPPRQDPSDWHAWGACVVPPIARTLDARFPGRFHWISPGDFPQLDCSLYPPGRLGADRLANLAAAHALAPRQAVMVVDCGTALNSVCLSPRGKFLGGVILPGRETALASLGRNTAQLPEFAVSAAHDFNPLGTDSEAAIRNGVDLGILGAVEKIVRSTREKEEMAQCRVWFTGGDAPFFVEHLPRELQVELAPLPLTLYGISLAAKR